MIKTRKKGGTAILCHGITEHNCTTAAISVHPVPTLHSCIPPATSCLHYKTSLPESPNICKLDSVSSCLCVSVCKHCSQSAASSLSATAASTVSALNFSERNKVGELNFQGHTETDSRNTSYESHELYSIREDSFDCGKN